MDFKKIFKDHFLTDVIWLIIGVVVTSVIFALTANPITTNGVREKLTSLAMKSVLDQKLQLRARRLSVDSFSFQKIGLDLSESVVSYGTIFDEKSVSIGRWIAVFEPSEQRLLDKLVGRTSFYELKFINVIDIDSAGELMAKNIEAKDLDSDGVFEFIIKLESQWGDSRSNGFALVYRTKTGEWMMQGLPDMAASIRQSMEQKIPEVASYAKQNRQFSYFGKINKENFLSSQVQSKDLMVYQDEYLIKAKKKSPNFYMLRNGGNYSFIEHPLRKTNDVAIIAILSDNQAIMGAHHSAVTVYSFNDDGLVRDINWNWGYSMLSAAPMRANDIDLKSIIQAGTEAHIEGNIILWYTSFERNGARR